MGDGLASFVHNQWTIVLVLGIQGQTREQSYMAQRPASVIIDRVPAVDCAEHAALSVSLVLKDSSHASCVPN